VTASFLLEEVFILLSVLDKLILSQLVSVGRIDTTSEYKATKCSPHKLKGNITDYSINSFSITRYKISSRSKEYIINQTEFSKTEIVTYHQHKSLKDRVFGISDQNGGCHTERDSGVKIPVNSILTDMALVIKLFHHE
jgi:hypothetical protein